jgi:hypothetical protein
MLTPSPVFRRRARLGGPAVLALVLAACGAPAALPAPSPEPASEPAAEPAAEPVAEPAAEPAPAACARVHLGLDLRAIGSDRSQSGIDMFVLSQAQELLDRAPPGPEPIVRHLPGTGILDVDFGAPSEPEALERCERALAAYLPEAARLPILMEPAVQVIEPCAPCPR